MTDFDHRKSSDNWAVVTYDQDRWIPMPIYFKGTRWADPAEWAFDQAGKAFLRGGRDLTKKVVKKEVHPFAELLLFAQREESKKIITHKFYLNCPDYTKLPVSAYVGMYKCQGTREQAFEYYSGWGARGAREPARYSEIRTDNLGAGVRSVWSDDVNGATMYCANYVFRNEEYNTDVHAMLRTELEERFWETLPEMDTFVHGIRCTPDPENDGMVVAADGSRHPA